MQRSAPHRRNSSPVAAQPTRSNVAPIQRRGGLIIFDYEDPTGRWIDARTSPFSDTEIHTFHAVPPSQRLARATEGARGASSRIRAGSCALFEASRDQTSTTAEADPIGQLVSTAAMGLADTPAYTLLLAPGRWRRYLAPFGIATDADLSAIPDTADLWGPVIDPAKDVSSLIVWRGEAEGKTLADVGAILARATCTGIAA